MVRIVRIGRNDVLIEDDIGFFQSLSDRIASTLLFDVYDYLMARGNAPVLVKDLKTGLVQRFSQRLGVLYDLVGISRSEFLYFPEGQVKRRDAVEVVVGKDAGEYFGLDALCELLIEPLAQDDASLRTRKGLMGGSGDDIGAFFERRLEAAG